MLRRKSSLAVHANETDNYCLLELTGGVFPKKERRRNEPYRHPSFVKPYPSALIVLPMVVHSAPEITPMFLTDRMVKKRSLSALSFQFLFMLAKSGETTRLAGSNNGCRPIRLLCLIDVWFSDQERMASNVNCYVVLMRGIGSLC